MAGSRVIGAIMFASGKTSAKVCGNELDKHAHTHTHTNTETPRTRWHTINGMDAESRSCTPLSLTASVVKKHALCKQALAD